MKSNWTIAKLKDCIYQDFESAVEVSPENQYKMVGVYSFGKGLFDKGTIYGSETSYKIFYRLKYGHIVFSQLFGWEGAIAFCDRNFENKFVSSQFPTFLTNEDIADSKYISYFLMQPFVWKKLYEVGVGMGSRRRTLNPSHLLNLEIPLPPLSEQKRIVAKIESIKSKIDAIRKLREEQEREINNLRNCTLLNLQNEFENILIGDVLVEKVIQVDISPEKIYKQVTVRLEHKGVTQRGVIKGSEIGSKQFLANAGDFIISKIDARNGAMGMIPTELDGAVVTGDFPLFNFSENVNPLFFNFFSNTYYFDDACKQASEGTTNRKRLKTERFLNIKMPLPPLEVQNRIVSILEKVNQIRKVYKEQEKELTELLPSLLDKAFKGEL